MQYESMSAFNLRIQNSIGTSGKREKEANTKLRSSYSLFLIPCSLFIVLYSLFFNTYSLFLIHLFLTLFTYSLIHLFMRAECKRCLVGPVASAVWLGRVQALSGSPLPIAHCHSVVLLEPPPPG